MKVPTLLITYNELKNCEPPNCCAKCNLYLTYFLMLDGNHIKL